MMNEEGIYNLINAIIGQAVKDYRTALNDFKRNPKNAVAEDEIRRIEKFFRGSWYEMMTDVDGEYLIQKIKKEVANNGRNSK